MLIYFRISFLIPFPFALKYVLLYCGIDKIDIEAYVHSIYIFDRGLHSPFGDPGSLFVHS